MIKIITDKNDNIVTHQLNDEWRLFINNSQSFNLQRKNIQIDLYEIIMFGGIDKRIMIFESGAVFPSPEIRFQEINSEKPIPFEILSKMANVLNKIQTVPISFFYERGYFPIQSDFMEFLLINYSNCEFYTANNQTYIDLNVNIFRSREHFVSFPETDFLPKILKVDSDYFWLERAEIKLPTVINFLIKSKKLTFLESILQFYNHKINIIDFISNYLKHNEVEDSTICNTLFSLKSFSFKEQKKESNILLNNILAYKYKDKINYKTIITLLKHNLQDPDFTLFNLICEKGNKECFNEYIKNIVMDIKIDPKKNAQIHPFKSYIQQCLKKIKNNPNISKPQELYYLLNRLFFN